MNLEVSDFDDDQSYEEQQEDYRRELSAWKEAGRHGPRPSFLGGRRAHAPEVVPGRMVDWREVRHGLERRVSFNVGAYRACYLASGQQVLASSRWGKIRKFVVSFDSTGFVHEVTDPHVPDDSLGECLRKALGEIWIEPVGVSFDMKVRLIPAGPWPVASNPPQFAPVGEVEHLAEAALAEGNGAQAERHFAALLHERSGPNRCEWHVGMLSAALMRAPWGDEHVTGALASLAKYVHAHSEDPALSICLGSAVVALRGWLEDDDRGERHKLALELLPELPNRRELRYRLAGILMQTDSNSRLLIKDDPSCIAGEMYAQLAREECPSQSGTCAPAWLAAHAFETCRSPDGFRHVCHGFPDPAPVPVRTEMLYRARRFLLSHSANSTERDRMMLNWAYEYAESWGQLGEAASLLHDLVAHSREPEIVAEATGALRDIEAHQTSKMPH